MVIRVKATRQIMTVAPIRCTTQCQMRNSAIQPPTVWEYRDLDTGRVVVYSDREIEIVN